VHCNVAVLHFSDDDESHNLKDDVTDRIVTGLDRNSVKIVSHCIAERNYLTICDLNAVGSASDINASILHALRSGMYVMHT